MMQAKHWKSLLMHIYLNSVGKNHRRTGTETCITYSFLMPLPGMRLKQMVLWKYSGKLLYGFWKYWWVTPGDDKGHEERILGSLIYSHLHNATDGGLEGEGDWFEAPWLRRSRIRVTSWVPDFLAFPKTPFLVTVCSNSEQRPVIMVLHGPFGKNFQVYKKLDSSLLQPHVELPDGVQEPNIGAFIGSRTTANCPG